MDRHRPGRRLLTLGKPKRTAGVGLTAREARVAEGLARRLSRELPDVTDQSDGDGIDDSADSDGEPIDDQGGDSRAGRLVAFVSISRILGEV